MDATPAPIFSPTPTAAAQILDECSDPSLTLRDIADRHNTTSHTLALWLNLPDIRAQLDEADAAVCHRTRRLVNAHLPAVATTLLAILHNYKALIPAPSPTPLPTDQAQSPPPPFSSSSDLYSDPSSPRSSAANSYDFPDTHYSSDPSDALLHLRLYEAARKTMILLVRLARTQPASHQPRTHAPQPRDPAKPAEPPAKRSTSLQDLQSLLATLPASDIQSAEPPPVPAANAPTPPIPSTAPPLAPAPAAPAHTPAPAPSTRISLSNAFLAKVGHARLHAQAAKQQPPGRLAAGPAP